ncbi:hypothetical protein PUN28_000411 [Cardiocondyla obscurior]|uniref:15-hydroxyprostaglandin dehydrogenase [NAD(+)] n=1 Tax=Cardiocondyla obscurior TaxID=286306 RepID=A0AAW2GZ89_9HYME
MYSVRDKTVMITGAARGIGYEFVKVLLGNGAKNVAVVDLPTSDGQNTTAALAKEFDNRAVFFACDVTNADELKDTFEKIVDEFKGLDIFINNAGMLNDKYWEQTIDLNVKALIRGSLLAFDHMAKHKGGKGGVVLNIASIVGLHPDSFFPMYSATKHAVLGFSQSLAETYDKTGVRVVIMCPGVTTTALTVNLRDKIYDSIRPAINIADDLIQKGQNGAAWVCEGGQAPYAVDFVHYSKRSLPV